MEPQNYIAQLNELAQKTGSKVEYEDVDCVGPDHKRTFTMRVVVNGKPYPEGVGKNKKEAKKNAAKNACDGLMEESINFRGDEEFSGASSQKEKPTKDNVSDICDKTRRLNIKTVDKSFTDRNFKGIINHYCQKKSSFPTYNLERQCGPPHDPQFFVKLVIDDKEYPVGEGKSLKEAEQNAAQLAWSALQEQSDFDSKMSVRSTESEDGVPLHSVSSATLNSYVSSQLNPDAAEDNNMSNGQNETSTQSRFISEFEPLELLGSGGFGRVYKAKDKILKKHYAVKIVRCEEKCFKEVGTLSDLHHKNIIRYYTCWMEDTGYQMDITDDSYSYSQSIDLSSAKYLYISMELCNKTLREWINEKNSQPPQGTKRRTESLEIAQQIFSGVEYIHSKNHIHRDLKPENIMFGLEGEVKIGDFGLVTRDDVGDPSIERSVERGTPTYMAPEQHGKNYNRKVDIFALGLIFFELLWKISTGHERGKMWENARSQKLPKEFSQTFYTENRMIVMMLSEKPEDRPEASALKADLDKQNSQKNLPQQNLTF
ncbi:hypothetical protein Q5P01_021270 [Channa striata]|uniref:non-specific serine/threonine protein kinase n=1 Tax=Channa striata TaxID=64152 RepID=A0AA88LTX5_CHASR|nr:hypothetical protein Q5P01_021270 [Channa striata]